MKRMKAMAAIMAATAVVSTCALPVCAAESSASGVQAVAEAVAADEEVQSEVVALSEETTTQAVAFDWSNLGLLSTGNITDTAYKVDLSDESMADDSLADGSTVMYTLDSEGNYVYQFTIMTTSAEQGYEGHIFTAKPTSAVVTYYTSSGTVATVNCNVSDGKITFNLPADAKGMAPTSGSIPGGYKNMIKVNMTTSLNDNWLADLIFPDAMKNPTFFYAFTVTPQS